MAGCAGRKLLECFLAGDLDAAANDAVALHVEGCLACQEVLELLSDGMSGPFDAALAADEDPEPAPSSWNDCAAACPTSRRRRPGGSRERGPAAAAMPDRAVIAAAMPAHRPPPRCLAMKSLAN